MKRLRCGETTCLHHNGDCIAQTIEVRTYSLKPQCNTYEVSPVETNTAQLHMMGEGNGMIGDAMPSGFPTVDEQSAPEKTGCGRIVCTESSCYYNHDYTCRSSWVSIGLPKGKVEIDTECKTFIPI